MRTITLGTKGWIALGVAVALFAGGVWAWQAGYLPEIGRFFAAETGAPVPIRLTDIKPTMGPAGTWAWIEGENLPVNEDGEVKVRFGDGVISGYSDERSVVAFQIPSEMPVYCPPGAYCILSMLPVQPGPYQVSVENDELCTPPTPMDDGRVVADVAYECGRAQSNSLTFTVTEGPVCVQPPACVYEMPSCDIPYPDEGWCLPVEGISITRPTEGGVVSLGDTSYTISWDTDPAHLPSGPVNIMLYQYSPDFGGTSLWIARDVPNQGWYNWDTTQPMTDADDGSSRNLRSTPEDNFLINISIPDKGVWGTSGNFSLVGDFPTPPPPPPSFPPPPLPRTVSMRFEPQNGTTPPLRIYPGRTVGVNVFMDIAPGTRVSGVDLHIQYHSGLNVTDFEPSPSFPEILRQGQGSFTSDGRKEFSVALGTGPEGRVTGRALVGTLTVAATSGATNASDLRMDIHSDTVVTAVDSSSNVMGPGDSLHFTLDASSALAGDLDGDGDVDIYDYNIVVTNFGKRGSNPGDADHDGDVDIFDYNIVVTNFGR